jgi:hypothetical protein
MSYSRLACHLAIFVNMALTPNNSFPVTDDRPSYRLVVKARQSGHKGYVWEIVREDDNTPHPVSRSSGSYETMEAAYTKGSVALARVRASGTAARSD